MRTKLWGSSTQLLTETDLSDGEVFLSLSNAPQLTLRLIAHLEDASCLKRVKDIEAVITGAEVEEVEDLESIEDMATFIHEWIITPTGEGSAMILGGTVSWFDVEGESTYKVTDFDGRVAQVDGEGYTELLSDSDEELSRELEALNEKEKQVREAIRSLLKKSFWSDEQIEGYFTHLMSTLFSEFDEDYDLEVKNAELVEELSDEWRDLKRGVLTLRRTPSKGH